MTLSIIQNIVMLCVIYAECHIQAIYAECHYAERRYAECRDALKKGKRNNGERERKMNIQNSKNEEIWWESGTERKWDSERVEQLEIVKVRRWQ